MAAAFLVIVIILGRFAVFGSCSDYVLDEEIASYLHSEYPGKCID
jgi:hypothetical protein